MGDTSSPCLQGCSCSIQGLLGFAVGAGHAVGIGGGLGDSNRGRWPLLLLGSGPLSTGRWVSVCRSSGKQQMRGFAQCSLPRALWPQRKDQSGSQGTAGCGSRLRSPCRVRLSLGMVAFPQPIPILSHHSVRMAYSASIGAAPVWPTPWQSLEAQPCHSLSLSRCTGKDTKM